MVDEDGSWIPGRGQAVVESAEKARAWERQLARCAPAAAEAYALQHGNKVLEQTSRARLRSFELLRELDSTKSIRQQVLEFEAKNGLAFRKEAERLAQWPGVMQIAEGDELYTLACCAVLGGERGAVFIGEDPIRHDELMWQIQLVVDGILLWKRESERAKEETEA